MKRSSPLSCLRYRFISIVQITLLAYVAPAILKADYSTESGLSRIDYYPPHAYNGHSQVFQSAQDSNGIIYITSYGAIQTWDSVRWKRISIPGAGFLYGITKLENDTFAICGVNTVGIIESDGNGSWNYRSIVNDLPEADQENIGEVWDMAATPEGLYFFTRRRMIRWRNGETKIWNFETEKMIYGFWSGSSIYVQNLDDGLYQLINDEVVRVSSQPIFQAPGPRLIIDWEEDALLISTMQEGIWIMREGELKPFAPEASKYLSQNVMNRGLRMRDGNLALGTFQGGLVIVNKDGSFQKLVNEASGLPTNTITHLSQDREGGLWVSQGAGISRVEVDGIITHYDRTVGLPNVVVSKILRHKDSIYLSSGDGIHRMKSTSPPDLPSWESVPETSSEAHAMIVIEDELFAATKGKVIRFDGTTTEVVWDDFGLVRTLHALESNPDHLLVGGRMGLGLVYKEGDIWTSGSTIPDFEDHIISIAEDKSGTIWLGTVYSGVIRIRNLGTGKNWYKNIEIERFGTDSGLESTEHVLVRFEEGKIVATPPTGPQSFDPKSNQFSQAEVQKTYAPPDGWAWDVMIENQHFGAIGSVYPLVGAEDDFALYVGKRSPEGEWNWISPDIFEQTGGLLYLYLEEKPTPVLWAGGWSGLLRWDLRQGFTEQRMPNLNVSIRTIRLPDNSIAYEGAGPITHIEFPHSRGEMYFEYVASVHTPDIQVQYRTKLLGWDKDWTEWAKSTERLLTNLPSGDYTFLIEAKTPAASTVKPQKVTFTVQPPWYQTIPAYIAYLILAAFLIWALIQLRLAALRMENRKLERMVSERTSELAESEAALRKARDAADYANEQKSRFLANMSHELRTPLNAIMGYAQILNRDSNLDTRNRNRVRILNTSSNLLLHLINEVLDLSKIEAGRLELQESTVHIERSIKALVDSFAARAAQKQLKLQFNSQASIPEWVQVDVRKVEQILSNLIGNALKFTKEGTITVSLSKASGKLHIDVSDTGVGISKNEVRAIFDAFYQTRNQEGVEPGTGLGLAISKRLSEVMGGELSCSSDLGKGTQFVLSLPLKEVVPINQESRTQKQISGYEGEKRTILVVDDIAANRDVVAELLEPLGFEVIQSPNGMHALDYLSTTLPGIILLDIRMSPMDGKEVLDKIRKMKGGADIPIISYTASILGFTRSDAIEMGCDDWLPKPFAPEELFHKIGDLLKLKWSSTIEEEVTAKEEDYLLSFADIEQLKALTLRGDPIGLKKYLEEIRAREPESAATISPLLNLVSTFRLAELGDILEQLNARGIES